MTTTHTHTPRRLALGTRRTVVALAATLCIGLLPAAVAGATAAAHSQLVALHDPLATMGDQFGHAVAISASGTVALVGAYDTNGGVGAAYLYRATGSSWSTTPFKTFSDPGAGADHFGFSVALSPDGTTAYVGADHLAVGARTNAGAVFVYHAAKGVWPTSPTQTINDPGTASGDVFGVSISISPNGKTLAVGAPIATVAGTAQAGEVYVYAQANGKFPAAPTASIPDPSPTLGRGFFGYSVALSNVAVGTGILAVGAYVTTVKGADAAGAAYVFQERSAHLWALAKGGRLTDPADVADDFFGGAVATDATGSHLMVGAQDETEHAVGDAGAVFTYTPKAGKWGGPRQTLVGPIDGPANFSSPSMSANGAVAVTGAGNEQVGGNNYAGEAFVFVAGAAGYGLGASIPDPTGGSPVGQEYFGAPSALSANGDVAVIAAPATTGSGGAPGPGAVYVYDVAPAPSVTKVAPSSGPHGGHATVTISGTFLSGATSVAFGTTKALHFKVNATGTSISAVTPPEAVGTVHVVVTTPGGATAVTPQSAYRFT